MAKSDKWAFNPEGATKLVGGCYGPHSRFTTEDHCFHVWYVTNENGLKFERSPYVVGGWVQYKNRTNFEGRPVAYRVRDEEQIAALNAFCGLSPYMGWHANASK